MQIVGIVVAGGVGSRLGDGRPKQLQSLGGKRILDRSVEAIAAASHAVVVVAHPELLSDHQSECADLVVAGGATRADSVRAGLAAAEQFEPTHVLIHDAARPAVPEAVIDRVVDALGEGNRAVVPVVPVTDSLRHVDGGAVDRTRFKAAQTPQGFEYDLVIRAHDSGADATDDASLVDALGEPVVHVDGDPRNIKITVAADLALAEILLR
ncbi:MAG: 2-C-methyl-D-erythritol 4-phosphate cytidylyltransferase [Acidimicrobiales bacterium]